VRLRPSWQRRWRLRPPSLLRAWVGLWCLRPLWRSPFFLLRRMRVRLAVMREEAPSSGFFHGWSVVLPSGVRFVPQWFFFIGLAYTRLFITPIYLSINVSFFQQTRNFLVCSILKFNWVPPKCSMVGFLVAGLFWWRGWLPPLPTVPPTTHPTVLLKRKGAPQVAQVARAFTLAAEPPAGGGVPLIRSSDQNRF